MTARNMKDLTPEERRARIAGVIARSQATRERIAARSTTKAAAAVTRAASSQASAHRERFSAPAVHASAQSALDRGRETSERVAARLRELAPSSRAVRDALGEVQNLTAEVRARHAARVRAESRNRGDVVARDTESRIDGRLADLERQIASMRAASRLAAKADSAAPGADDERRRAYASAVRSYMRQGDEAELRRFQARWQTLSDPDGGFFVTPEVDSQIDALVTKLVAMRQLATVRTTRKNLFKKPINLHGASGGWLGETDADSETNTATFSEMEFPVMKCFAEPVVTQDLLDDADFDMEAFLVDEVNLVFAEQEGAAYITGDGVKKPRGVLSYPFVANASWAWGKVGYIATGVSGDWPASAASDKLYDLAHALKKALRPNAQWLMNPTTLAGVRKMKDTTGQYLWQPGLQLDRPSTLLGKEIAEDDGMPDLAANSYSVGFGDWKRSYLIVDRQGASVLRDNLTQKGFVKFFTTRRVAGGIQNFEAAKFLKFGTS